MQKAGKACALDVFFLTLFTSKIHADEWNLEKSTENTLGNVRLRHSHFCGGWHYLCY